MAGPIYVGVVGAGLVGAEFLRQLAPVQAKLGVKVVFVARSKQSAVSKDYKGLDITKDLAFTAPKLSAVEQAEFLSKSPDGKAVLVDNTADEQFALQYPEFVKRNVAIVTPNKKAFSSSLELWNELQKGVVYHEATVGAGLPILSTLKDLVQTGDKIKSIEGILSGTLSYIFNTFASSSESFSEIVSVAKTKGYTEPDPRDDLNGMDVARKVTILARLAGLPIAGPSAFPVESLIPEQLASVKSGDEFIEKLPQFDEEWAQRKSIAAKEGKVLRYVGSVDVQTGKASVAIREYPTSHPFASLTGSDNVVSFTTERYPSPLIIQGAGAGAAVTAMGVLSDLFKVVDKLS